MPRNTSRRTTTPADAPNPTPENDLYDDTDTDETQAATARGGRTVISAAALFGRKTK